MATRTETAISDRFGVLLARITPDASDAKTFAQHQASIESRLKSAMRTHSVVRIGSYTRGSAIRWSSDIDLLLVLKRDEVRWGNEYKRSGTVLDTVRAQLQDRYTRTDIGRDGQAVVISFNDGQHPVDVVPGFYWEPGENNYPVFYIPDGDGGWMQTSPQLHNKFIGDADQRSGGKLKGVSRLVKYWSGLRANTQSLSGFHVELLLANSGICSGVKSYADCFLESIAQLATRSCRALQDPKGLSCLVKAAGTENKRNLLNNSLQGVLVHCRRARAAMDTSDTLEAIHQWNTVFNDCFPR